MNRGFLLPTASLIKIMLACGIIQIGAYYFMASWATSGRHLAVPQPDSLLYCQSARQIVEGMPFAYSPGEKPSTGCTSHLYPFLLAPLYAAGAKGDALLTAGFVLNAVFYLLFLVNWGLIVRRLTASRGVRSVACVLLALNGHAAYGALSQSDVGLFMAVSSGAFALLLSGQVGWLAALLVAAPWCRPEGIVLAVLYAVAVLVRRVVLRQRVTGLEWLAAALAVASSIGVFVFNYWLTGIAQFQSVYFKGYFKQYDFVPAVNLALGGMMRMVRELLFGLPVAMPREGLFIPLLGALFAWFGLLSRRWSRENAWKELWWLGACVAGMGVVASSGWQNINMDRYLVWLLPVWLVYMAGGVIWVARRFPDCGFRLLPFLIVAGFQGVGAVWLATTYYYGAVSSQQNYDFAKDAHALLDDGASLGGTSHLAYGFPGRRVMNISGIYSPDLFVKDQVLNLERFKHRPALRFDYWSFSSEAAVIENTKVETLCGPVVAWSADKSNIRRACWDVLDRTLMPARAEGFGEGDGWRLTDRLDVGYPEDEKRCGYTTYSRFYRTRYAPFGVSGYVGTNTLFEVGRVVIGGDSMTVRLCPQQPVRVVLRTLAKAETEVQVALDSERQKFTFESPLKLRVHVDGKEAGLFALPLSTNETAFSEIAFTLPAESIQNPSPRLTVYGDHVALAYWFYQPGP